MEIVPVTRKEKFIKAAIEGVPLSIDAIPRIEMYLAKISGDNVDLPDPITRIEKYLAVIAGMDVVLPSPVTRVEKYLAKIAGMDVETPNPVTRIEMLLDEWAESSGGVLKTVSGAVVSVSDALKKAIVSLVVSLEPIQDLHGYANPWPAGGGKNKFLSHATTATKNDLTFTANEDGTIKVNGTASADTIYVVSEAITGSPGDGLYCHLADMGFVSGESYIMNGCPSGGSVSTYRLQLLVYGSGSEPYDTGNGTSAITFSESDVTDKWYRLAIRISSGTAINNLVFKPMIRLSSVSDANYAPYSNICPISGHDRVKVTRTGKNLLDQANATVYNRYFQNFPQQMWTMASDSASFAIPCTAGVTYTVTMTSMSGNIFRVGCIKEEIPSESTQNPLIYDYTRMSSAGSITITPSSGAKYIVIQLPQNEARTAPLMVELGSHATDFEPYQGNLYTIELDGTVYGGTLDVTTGVLTVTHKYYSFNGSEAWSVAASGYAYLFGLDGSKSNADLTQISNMFVGGGDQYAQYGKFRVQTNGAICVGNRIDSENVKWATKEEFKAFLSDNNLHVCYELATPLVVQLTPTEIEMLEGNNTLWADTGDITVTYMADGPADDVEALNILLGNRYVNLGEPDEATDREALDILLGGR